MGKETRERVALEVSMRQGFQATQADFEQEVAQRNATVKDLKHSYLTLFKERCEEKEQLMDHVKEMLEAVKREHLEQFQDLENVRNDLKELRVDIDGGCHRIND